MDFFQKCCQSGPYKQACFGLCDDQNSTRAYVDTVDPQKWVATVENPSLKAVTFTAIDKCVMQDVDEPGRGRCDCMLTTENLLYLVELKEQEPPWRQHALNQLESTIRFLLEHHDISRFRHKKAFACNKSRQVFATIDNDLQLRFRREYGFRIDVQATVLVLP